MSLRIGVDIGGTFTDGVMLDDLTGTVYIEKILSTPEDLSSAFMDTVERLLAQTQWTASDVQSVMHASTVATNALLEHKGAKVGLLVTAGFRDILEIGRQVRSELYDFFTAKPPPLVERRFSLEVRERLNRRGEVVVALNEQDVVDRLHELKGAGVDSIAICFLHSYRNAAHEARAAEIAREIHPTARLSISSELAPEIKEYWRASTSCVNAYVSPVVNAYLEKVVTRLASSGFDGTVGIMHSGGGTEGIEAIKERPFQMIESGPAAGVAAASYFAKALGYDKALSFDMGGTTAKAGLILNGQSRVLAEFEVVGGGRSGSSVAKASGYPVLGEVVDLVEVGAGGGSIAWVDDGGHLRVGPTGAGADPGPACYNRGGASPTISDANLVLGRLDADHFLGGSMRLSATAARAAIMRDCAEPLGMSLTGAASGIIEVADATMVEALRLVSVERGHDPREFCLIAFGGAGPVHACSVASKLGIDTILVLPRPGVASALGLLLSDVKHDVRSTHLRPLSVDGMNDLRKGFSDLNTRLSGRLQAERTNGTAFELQEYIEARYLGQSSRLRINTPQTDDAAKFVEWVGNDFNATHETEYGFCVRSEPIEIVTLGITGTARVNTKENMDISGPTESDGTAPSRNSRRVYFVELDRAVETPVYERHHLAAGHKIYGPAIIEEMDSTTVVTPRYTAESLANGVLLLKNQSAGSNTARAGE